MVDLYQVLGVPRQATEKEIKIAYRKNAKEKHPDINKEEGAKEAFIKYQEAYDILSHSELRKEYDNQLSLGEAHEFRFDASMFDILTKFMRNRQHGSSPIQGKHFVFDLPVRVTDILQEKAVKKTVSFEHVCTTCIGKGQVASKKVCTNCQGSGGEMQEMRTPFGTLKQRVACTHCDGLGKEMDVDCHTCKGQKQVKVTKKMTILLKKTYNFGQEINVPKEGGPGLFGGNNGDIQFVLTQSKDDEIVVLHSKDLECSEYVSIQDALLGNTVTLTMPSGELRNVELTKQLQNPRNQLVFPNEGLYHNGNRGIYSVRIVVDFSVMDEQLKSSLIEGIRKVEP